ncbi:MAG: LysR family transcriptional regulator [Proteobacteria bacterium]|nr:LysR family transcriptional regulator [Pseudomonadota bacterium]
MVDFKALETLVWVATLKSFNRAAAKLNTTQPAVSQRIAQLEADIGHRLLEREKRTVVPTEAGRRVLDYAERLLKLRIEMMHAVADRTAIRGTLRLGVAETIVHTWLSRFVERMAKAYPGLVLEIEVDITPNLRDRLVGQELDLVFALGAFAATQLKNLPLCTYRMAFLAGPGLVLPQPAPLAMLAAHPILTFSRNTRPYLVMRELFSAPGLPPVRIHASSSMATILRMAEDGLGIAAVPEEIAGPELGSGRLRALRTSVPLPDLDFFASWRMTPAAATVEAVATIAAEVARAA